MRADVSRGHLDLLLLGAVARRPLSAEPTVREVLFAIAGLGGHLRSNGEPGWLVLGRGFADLLALETGWAARSQRM
jgi:hypothetical protein